MNMMKTAVRLFLGIAALCLCASSSTYAASAKMQKLFASAQAYIGQVRIVCKTDACQRLTADIADQIKDAQEKEANGMLVDDEKVAFHKKLGQTLMALVQELSNVSAGKSGAATATFHVRVKSLCATQLRSVADTDQCSLCDKVFAEATGVCALYTIVSPVAAAICEGVAIYEYNDCIATYCSVG